MPLPQITSTPPDSYIEMNEEYRYAVTTHDAEGDAITLTAETKPSWLTFAGDVLSGTPASIGSYPVVLRAGDDNSFREQRFTIAVSALGNDAPVISSKPDTGVIETQFYSYTIAADDADGDTLTYVEDLTPSWLSLNGNVLSGTAPFGSSLEPVMLSVYDGEITVTQRFNVAVFNMPPSANLLRNGSLEGGLIGWTISGGATAELSSSPDFATDGSNSLKFAPATDGYIPRSGQSVTVVADTEYTLSFSYRREGGSTGALVVRAGGMQKVYYNASAGWVSDEISFNSGAATSIDVEFWMDGSAAGVSYIDNFVLPGAGAGNTAPVITSVQITDATVDIPYSYTLMAADAEGDDLILRCVSDLAGSWLSYSAGVLSGTPTVAGTIDVELSVDDGQGGSDTQNFTITVTGGATGYEVWASEERVDAGNLTNLLEYALDGDTTTYGDSEPTFTMVNGELKYIHNQHSTDSNLKYIIQTCTNLTMDSWQNTSLDAVTNVTESDYNVVTNTIPTVSSQSYIRLQILNP